MAVVGSLIVLLGTNNAPLNAGLLAAEGRLKAFGNAGGGSAKGLAIVGGAGLIAAAGIAVAINAAGDFEDAFAGVKKTVDETDLAAAGLTFDDLSKQFRTMATEIPVSAVELAKIGETAGALGIHAADIDDFTRTVALLGATTNLSTEQAGEALGKVGTILGITGSGFEDFGDILVNLGNKGASTESEIIEITKRFAAAGQAAGLTIPEILGFSSAIASAGVEPEAAGSSLSRVFSNMVKETANATSKGKAFATVTGKSFGDFSQMVKTDTVGAMLLFLDKLNDLDKFGQAKALQSVGITAVRDQNAIQLLAQTYDQNLIPALQNAETASGALGTEASKRFDTFNTKVALLGNSVNELAIKLGTALLPAATDFVNQVSGAINGLEGTVQKVVAAYNSLPQGLRDLLEKPVDISQIAPNLFNPSSPSEGIKPGLTDTVAMAIGLMPKDTFDRNKPWGTFGTPGFGAGEAGSPFLGPATPGDLFPRYQGGPWGAFNTPGFGAGQPGSPYAGPPTPTQVNHTTTVYIGNEKIGDIVERVLYNSASATSSGWATSEGVNRH